MRMRAFLIFALLVAFLAIPDVDRALAGNPCADSGYNTYDHVGGQENNSGRRGDLADVLVNSFQANQHFSWRAVAILVNGNNLAESGWLLWDGYNQNKHPYKTWIVDSEVGSTTFTAVNLSSGVNHEFKVHDANGDNHWSFAYDGNPMGNQYAPIGTGTPLSESERCHASDSLWANFTNLSAIRCLNCAWQGYNGLSGFETGNNYDFCWVSNTHYRVKQSC